MKRVFHNEFKDNRQKRKIRIIVHYTASSTAESALSWLNKRNKGNGTVGYNCIIDKDAVHFLCSINSWFHNTGLGGRYDKDTYSIAFTGNGIKDITDEMIEEAKKLIRSISVIYDITEIRSHRCINIKKPDFSREEWKILKNKITGEYDGNRKNI